MRSLRALCLFLLSGIGSTSAQQTLFYTNGESHSSPIPITTATNPTTLTAVSGTTTQSGTVTSPIDLATSADVNFASGQQLTIN